MANAITIGRLALLFVTIWLMYVGDATTLGWCMLLIALVIFGDGLDGWWARRTKTTSTFGAVFDIAGDRIVENALWFVFADLNVIPIWIPLLVLSRGFIVDGIRSISIGQGMTAFGEKNMMRSPLTQWLTAGRFMRATFGYAKALAYIFLAGLVAWNTMDTDGTFIGNTYQYIGVRALGWVVVWAAVALTVIRGLPVLWDAVPMMREVDKRKREQAKA